MIKKPSLSKHHLKPLLFIGIILLLQWYIGIYISLPVDSGEGDFENLALLQKYLKTPIDILYFGDSSNYYTPTTDTDRHSISRNLQDRMPGTVLRSISHAAYQLDIYAAFCSYLVKQKNHPRLIIIPINMRSFSPDWDLEPYYQFEREKSILLGGLHQVFFKPLRVLKYKSNTLTRKNYLATPVFLDGQKIGTIKQIKKIKEQLILRYMYTLTPTHRKVESLLKIINLASSNNFKVLFYITPIDYQTGEQYHPGSFTMHLTRNITLIRSLLEDHGGRLLDLSMDVPAENFAWKSKAAPNEHLNQEGRKHVANELAKAVTAALAQ